MKKIAITGSLASGKTTASKIISKGKGPLFSADAFIRKLYLRKSFKVLISKKFKFRNSSQLKKKIRKLIIKKKSNLQKLEKIIHPMVRNEIKKFIKKNDKKKLIFFEIPLLIESKQIKNYDIIIFIKAKKKIRY